MTLIPSFKNTVQYLVIVSFLITSAICSEPYSVSSPDGRLVLSCFTREGVPYYTYFRDAVPVLRDSRLGMALSGKFSFENNLEIFSVEYDGQDETWEQPWGEKRYVRNHYREMLVTFVEKKSKAKMKVRFRVFDDGMGFRYEWDKQAAPDSIIILDELTSFHLSGKLSAWWIPAYRPNRYEYLYRNTPLNKIDTVHTPLTMESNSGFAISIHEAALTDFASMTLARIDSNLLKVDLVPWSDGVKVYGVTPFCSPWRTVQIAGDPGGLITSSLILNLNEPCKIEDTSWIKPGKYVGIWWEMHIGKSTWGSGTHHGATTQNALKYIDFAAEHGFSGVLIEGWNQGWDGDWTKNGDLFNFTLPYPDFDIEKVSRYARSKGVNIIGHHETGGSVLKYERELDGAFRYYSGLGIHTVKTGYVNWGTGIKRYDSEGNAHGEWHYGQFMVRHYRKVVEKAAECHIMLDVHEPIKPTGIRRTYPNMMTREGARGQEYNAWSGDGGNPPEHTVILPFTRLLGGPMDFTPGIFDIQIGTRPNNQVNTTLAKQLALYVVIFSPLQMAADLPENYRANPEPFKFIEDVPTDWEDTKVLNAVIGDYLTIVRKDRNSEDWYLGAITDEEPRSFSVNLSFLNSDREYIAEIYTDGKEAHYKKNPLSIKISSTTVNSKDVFPINLAPGGGTAVRFHPVDR